MNSTSFSFLSNRNRPTKLYKDTNLENPWATGLSEVSITTKGLQRILVTPSRHLPYTNWPRVLIITQITRKVLKMLNLVRLSAIRLSNLKVAASNKLVLLYKGADTRSLALFRICLALIIIADVLTRISSAKAFLSDAGLTPRMEMIKTFPVPALWQLYYVRGEVWWSYLLFAVTILCAILLLLGIWAQFSAFACWFLCISLQCRTPMLEYGAHDLMNILCFWSIFIPLDLRWSLKKSKTKGAPLPTYYASMGVIALLSQPIVMYISAACEKWGASWLTARTAIYYALEQKGAASAFGETLLHYPSLLKHLTFLALFVESVCPFLLMIPGRFGLRLATLAALVGLQLGIFLTFDFGTFPFVSTVAILPFIPSRVWNGRDVGTAKRLVLNGRGAGVLFLNIIPFSLLVLSVVWCCSQVRVDYPRVPVFVDKVAKLLHLDQSWKMYSEPSDKTFSFLVTGITKNGLTVDVVNKNIAPAKEIKIPDHLWLRYFESLKAKQFAPLRPIFGRSLCREWNSQIGGTSRLQSTEIHVVLTKVQPPPRTESSDTIENFIISSQMCG